jgi:segregation and condensation protein A
MSVWQVRLPRFEGPLDLLLFLVSRQEYDIMDLPMAEVTESYWAALDSIGVENLEDAGDYLLMAATLLAIKAKLMLPRPAAEEMAEEVEDPRRELAQRLLLYQKAKEEAERLGRNENEMLERWELGLPAKLAEADPGPDEMLLPMTLYDLARALEDVLGRHEDRAAHQVTLDKITLEQRMSWVLELLRRLERFALLRQLQEERERMVWVVTILAILELAKRQQLRLSQNRPFSEIHVSRATVRELQAA